MMLFGSNLSTNPKYPIIRYFECGKPRDDEPAPPALRKTAMEGGWDKAWVKWMKRLYSKIQNERAELKILISNFFNF
jgi:hypothetical protein